jgi:hypothetical protein
LDINLIYGPEEPVEISIIKSVSTAAVMEYAGRCILCDKA